MMSPWVFFLLIASLLGCPGEPEPEYPTDYTLTVAIDHAEEGAGTIADAATLTLDAPAVDPIDVTLTTGDALVAPTSGEVTLEPGRVKLDIGLVVGDDATIQPDRTVTVTVDVAGLPTRTFDFTVEDNEPRSVTLTGPASVSEGAQSVALQVKAAASLDEAVSFTLSVEPPGALVLPSSATVAAGADQVVILAAVPDNAVLDFSRDVTVSAVPESLLDTPAPLTITILDDEPATLALDALVTGLTESDGAVADALRVTVGAPPAQDLVVALHSDRTDLLQVAPSITVPAGATTVDVALNLVDNTTLDPPESARVTASAPGLTGADLLVPVADDDAADFEIEVPSTTLTEGDGSLPGWATVSTGPILSYDLVVDLGTTDTSELTVPSTVTIPSGSDHATFPVTVIDDAWLDFDQSVTLSASAGSWSDQVQIVVQDDEPSALAVDVADVEVWETDGSLSDVVSVHTGAPVQSDLTVALTSGDEGELQVESPVTLLAGASSANVTIDPVDDEIPDFDQSVWITATASGCTAGQGEVVVHDVDSGYAVELRQDDAANKQWIDFGAFPGWMYDSDWALAEKFMIPVDAQSLHYQLIRGSAYQDREGDFSVNVRIEPDPQVSQLFLPLQMNAGQGGVTLDEGNWHTLVIQYDNVDTTAYLYVDGVNVDSADLSPLDDRDDSNPLVFGGQWCDPDYSFCTERDDLYLESDAALAHLAIWQRVLTEPEIAAYDGSVDLSDPTLVLSTAIGDGVVEDLIGSRPVYVHGDPLFYRLIPPGE